jgi:tetratricopeptide (TPR) repeat protein
MRNERPRARSSWRPTAVLITAALGAAPSGLAHAQSPEEAPVPTEPSSDEARARELFRQGSVYYEGAQYDEAIARFEEAYRLSARPALLFNIAQAYRQKGPAFCATALRYYERNLQEEADASNQAEIQELMLEMRHCADAAAGPINAVPPPVPLAMKPASTLVAPAAAPSWPVWTTRAGVGLGVLGLAGYTAARLKYDAVKDSCPCEPGSFAHWQTLTNVSYVLIAGGAATTAVGLVFRHWLGRRAQDAVALALLPVPSPRADAALLPGALLNLTLVR